MINFTGPTFLLKFAESTHSTNLYDETNTQSITIPYPHAQKNGVCMCMCTLNHLLNPLV